MVPRPRNQGSKDLPANLYRKTDKRNGETYYTYRDPMSGRIFGLGKDKAQAVKEALAANHVTVTAPQLVDRLVQKPGRPFDKWLERYQEIVEERDLSDSTRRNLKMRIKRLGVLFGEFDIRDVTTIKVADYLTGMSKDKKAQMSRAMRSLLRDVFMEAMAAGWVDSNPVEATKAARVKIKRERLTLEMWKAIYSKARQPWLKRAMELAILTGQRREDIASMLFKDVHERHLHVVQSKTGQRLRLSTGIRLDSIDLDLETLIKRCRDRVVAQHLVHHTRNISRAKAGQAVMLDTLSAAFAAARKAAVADGMITVGESPPSFHEQRSLAARLHAAEGRYPQALLGHRSAKMTDLYRDSRGAEWIDVA